MKSSFQVRLLKYQTQRELPGAWNTADYRALLEVLEYDDPDQMAEAEVMDMCLLAMTDFAVEDAAERLLTYKLKDRLSKGQITNLSHEMEEQPMWEEYSDMMLHHDIYNVNQLIHTAFGKFPPPNAVKLQLEVTGANTYSSEQLKMLDAAMIVRILVGGTDDHNLMIRLFEEQIKGDDFPEAEAIIWRWERDWVDAKTCAITLYSSNYWLEDYKGIEEYTVTITSKDH